MLVGCSGAEEIPPNSASTVSDTQAMEFIDLSSGGLPLALAVDQGEDIDFSAEWNATFGRMEITDSDDLSIYVFQDTLSCDAKKEEIENGVFDVSYLIDSDSLIFYKTMLPDGSTPYWHFFASFLVGDVHYVFQNNPLIEVSEYQAKRMTEIVGKIHPARRNSK